MDPLVRFWECVHSRDRLDGSAATAVSLARLLTSEIGPTLGRAVHDWRSIERGAPRSVAVLLPPPMAMDTIPQKELRNNISEVLRRAEAGEDLTITVAGRPVARLGPTSTRQWVAGPALHAVWRTPAPRSLASDLEQFPAGIVDPFT